MAENNKEDIKVDNSEQKDKRLGFLKKVAYSITKFEKYPEMSAEGTARAIKYLVQIMILFSLIVACGLVYNFYQTINRGVNYIENNLPDITYNNGQLSVNSSEAIKIDTESSVVSKVIIDTNTEEQQQIDKYIAEIPENEAGAIILKDKAILKLGSVSNTNVYTYSELFNSISSQNIDNFSKQDIVNYVNNGGMIQVYVMVFVLMLIYIFFIYLLSVLVDALVLAVLGHITIWFAKLKLKFSAIYNMAVYSLTLSIILNAIYITVNTITGFEVKYFQIMYTSIAYIYLVAAIFIIRSDFIKKQGELMKIIEEQEKVREEIQEQEKKDKEEDKKDNKEPKKKEKGDEKGEEESTNNGEPNGLEA